MQGFFGRNRRDFSHRRFGAGAQPAVAEEQPVTATTRSANMANTESSGARRRRYRWLFSWEPVVRVAARAGRS
jgi:hypothetical protein